jgi:hypothetical protein
MNYSSQMARAANTHSTRWKETLKRSPRRWVVDDCLQPANTALFNFLLDDKGARVEARRRNVQTLY